MENIKKLIETVRALRGEGGCNWDREQTHTTLRPHMLEEAYEAVDAMNSGDMKHLREELGDVLLQVVLHSQIADERGDFNVDDVACVINEKLVRRHPHVFSNTEVSCVDDILRNWEQIKGEEKPHRKSVLDGVSKSQSALMSAQKLSKKAVKVGFEWQNEKQLYECIFSEFDEFKDACTFEEKQEELGDILFALVNLARWNGIDAEQALILSNEKFTKRFKCMEEQSQKPLKELTFDEWEELWKQAKEES